MSLLRHGCESCQARAFAEGRVAGPAFRERFIAELKADPRLCDEPFGEPLMMLFDETECSTPAPTPMTFGRTGPAVPAPIGPRERVLGV
ncbi:MAG: hypothetical protein HY554_12710 [Elusimicrobia bacterium]|nr:hypothetical protein [Elusimicrobiota bacterium]